VPTDPLRAIARRQHGLVTRAEALTFVTRHELATMLHRGELEWARPGVVRFAGAPPTWEQALLAACLTSGDGAVASFASAARLWGMPGVSVEDPIEITTPTRRRSRIVDVTVHDSFILDGWHVTSRRSVPVTSAARTLCDLTACWRPSQVETAVDDSLRRRIVSLRRLKTVFVDLAHRGRRRSTVMRAILEARLPGFDPGDSPREARLVRWIVGGGLPRPVQQHQVRIGGKRYHLDLGYPELKIAIEYDGWEAHRPRSSFDRDRARQNPLEIRGWLILRYTSASTREIVLAEVGAAISARTASM
jgi:very-short-patch-repair endonuclease